LADFRQALGIGGGQVHHQADNCTGLVIAPENANPAQLNEPGERFRRADQKPAAGTFEMDPVVADKPGESQRTAAAGLNQFKRKA